MHQHRLQFPNIATHGDPLLSVQSVHVWFLYLLWEHIRDPRRDSSCVCVCVKASAVSKSYALLLIGWPVWRMWSFYFFPSFSLVMLVGVPLCSPQTVWWCLCVDVSFPLCALGHVCPYKQMTHVNSCWPTCRLPCYLRPSHLFNRVKLRVKESPFNGAQKEMEEKKMIIERAEDMICLQGHFIYYLSSALIPGHSAPWLWFCRGHFMSELCWITNLSSISLASSKEWAFSLSSIKITDDNCWHCRCSVYSAACSIWCITQCTKYCFTIM